MNATASAFSSPETASLERQIETDELSVSQEHVWNETHRKVSSLWIRQNGYKRVCLQFPDDYLPHSNAITDSLKSILCSNGVACDVKIFVMADTSYGSCCVDEIAAEHVDADSIIHFGNACRSKVTRLPVLYMFPHLPIDVEKFCSQLESQQTMFAQKDVNIFLDVGYHHLLESQTEPPEEECLTRKIKELLPCKSLHLMAYPLTEESKSEFSPSDESICVFVGADNSNFSNLSLTSKAGKWLLYDPPSSILVEKNPLMANYIRRRYYYIEKCKDAQTLGIIVATLTAEGYLDVIARLQEMARSRGIKTQLISVGRINPAKLANFLEIDCFVLIGCPFNNLYTSKDFYKPVVSVFEAEMALNPAWHMKYPEAYVTDFKELLPEGKSFLPFDGEAVTEQDVSLVSGRVRNANMGCEASVGVGDDALISGREQTVMRHGKMEVMTTNTGLTFEDRTWKGLDPALGCTEPAKIQKGLSGIPIRYTHD